jgi:hypothetical protein
MNHLIGRSGELAFYANNTHGVVIDTAVGAVVASGVALDLFAENKWETSDTPLTRSETLLAEKVLATLEEDAIVASADRMYTIPKSAQAEAKKALEWRKEEGRGGTPVGLNTARTLAKGGQIGIRKIRHIAKYFPRHEVDKKGKGWKPGQDNFPSNGRIAWALWGGDAAWRWARAIVEREDKKEKSVTAGGYTVSNYVDQINYPKQNEELNPFKYAHELDANYGPEFLARVCLDGSGIDRLYMIDIDGSVYVWDDGCWDNLGHVDGDIWTYDRMLDDVYDLEEKSHVIIDPQSALMIAARMAVDPYCKTSVFDLDADEAALMEAGISGEDWEFIDQVITAAGSNQDGVYTPEERSENAGNQPRDAMGQFAKVGQKVAIGGDAARGSGTIRDIDGATGIVTVDLEDGRSVKVGSKYLVPADKANSRPNSLRVDDASKTPMDFSGIIGEPRTPQNSKKAHIPGTLPKLDVNAFINNYASWVEKERYKPRNAADKAAVKKRWPNAKFTDASIIAAADEKILTPSTSDVTPRYLAIVDQQDPEAMVDLVAIIPKTATSTSPIAYKRDGDKWVQDDQTLADLRSSTKPPVVELDKESLDDVLSQMAEEKPSEETAPEAVAASLLTVFDAFVAAGGLDRNRGNAEELRQYWTRGKGAAKIRWGTPGDWTRCVRQLSKYMGHRAKGYCQLRHKDATGVYTGSRLNPGRRNETSSLFATETDLVQSVIAQAELTARANHARERFGLVAGAAMEHGSKFNIPLLIPEDLESGDGRKFVKDSLSVRELPLPLLWQIKTGDGHMGSVVVGRIDYVERTENGIGNAYGVFDTGAYGQEAERLVRNGFIRGVSADLDQFEAEEEKTENAEDTEDVGKKKLTINHARVMAATIVAKPAFQECTISIEEQPAGDQEDEVIPADGIYEESVEQEFSGAPLVASGFLDGEIPMTPPAEWFKDPKLTKATPITVDPSGRIYGHIAAWHVNHIGMPRSTRPPRSKSKYAYFHTGVLRCDDGSDMPVGQLTLAGGHAPLTANAASAAKHYDDTASAIADVHMGEDEYGIWCAGSVRPDATEMQIRALRASAPSGDWRPINGSLELVAVCQVNVPGFPVARAMVASGKVMALVAAGASMMAIMKSQHVATLSERAYNLAELSASAPDLRSRVKSAKKAVKKQALVATAAKAEELKTRALVAAAVAELAKFSEEERSELADKGFALPDGSYPIRNEQDLRNAIQAYGRAKREKRVTVRKHIVKRAKALGKANLIPDEWKSAGSSEAASIVASMRSRLAEFAETDAKEISESDLKKLKEAKEEADKQTEEEIKIAEDIKAGKTTAKDVYDKEGRSKYTPKTQPRDAKGKYRKVLARLKQNLGVAGLQKALEKVETAENLEFAGDYVNSAKASSELLGMIDRLDTKALNPESLENVRTTAAELGKTIANLPLPFGKEAQKVRFSDLPAGLKTLIDGMISRVEAKIGKEDADIATANLKSFMSGADVYSQAEIQSEMNTLLRLLT